VVTTVVTEGANEAATTPPRRRGRWRRWVNARLAGGAAIVSVFVLIAVIGPYLVGSPEKYYPEELAPPSLRFPLGTTETGRSVLAQLIVGTRASMEVGILAAIVATVVAILIGVAGGLAGGKIDEGLAMISNIFLVIPALPLIIVVSAYLHADGILPLVLVIGLTSWAASARVLRAQTLSLRARDFVTAARVSGEHFGRLIVSELLPNELAIVISQVVFAMIFAILTEAGLAFLGIGNIEIVSWGSILYNANNAGAITLGAWWWLVPPGLCLAVLGAGLALINFGLDEVINPRLRGGAG